MSKIKNENGYKHYCSYSDNGVGKDVELSVTVWDKIQQFELKTTRGVSFFVKGEEAKKIAVELIELLTPIANT